MSRPAAVLPDFSNVVSAAVGLAGNLKVCPVLVKVPGDCANLLSNSDIRGIGDSTGTPAKHVTVK